MAERSSVLDALLGMRVIESTMLPGDMVLMVRNGETMHRFVWTANALADQEREIERLRAVMLSVRRASGLEPGDGVSLVAHVRALAARAKALEGLRIEAAELAKRLHGQDVTQRLAIALDLVDATPEASGA